MRTVASFAVLVVACTSMALGAPQTVGQGHKFASIQAAVSSASVTNGDWILVKDAGYTEPGALTIDKGVVIAGNADGLSAVTNGIEIQTGADGFVLYRLNLSGGTNVIDVSGTISNLMVKDCVIDCENMPDRGAYDGRDTMGTLIFCGNEIKNCIHWMLLDNGSGSDPAVPLDIAVFCNNYVHNCPTSSAAFRGMSTDAIDAAYICGNIYSNTGYWAAMEANRCTSVTFVANTVIGVSSNYPGWPSNEGHALQTWNDVTRWSLDMHDNVLLDNARGVWIATGVGGSSYIPSGKAYNNDFIGNAAWGVAVANISLDGSGTAGTGPPYTFTNNYWGATDGPSGDGAGSGDPVYRSPQIVLQGHATNPVANTSVTCSACAPYCELPPKDFFVTTVITIR